MAEQEWYERVAVINLAGPETVLGASRTSREVAAAVADSLQRSVVMEALLDLAGARLAAFHEAEAACVTHCTAASLAIAAAACLTGTDLAAIRRLPDTGGLARDRILMLRAQDVDYGGLVSQPLRTTGAELIAIGAANRCSVAELDTALADPRLAAALFVVSPSIDAAQLPDLPEFLHLCHRHGVPAIVDAAHHASAAPFLDAGADLVLMSAQKELAGPTAGIIAGRADLVVACRAQFQGIGRPMKPTKEAVAGVLAAIGSFAGESERREARTARRRQRVLRLLRRFPGLFVLPASSPERVRFLVDPARFGGSAREIVAALARHRPPVRLRDREADRGMLEVDLSIASDRDFATGLAALREALAARAGGGG